MTSIKLHQAPTPEERSGRFTHHIFRDPYVEITTTTLARLATALEVDVRELLESEPDTET